MGKGSFINRKVASTGSWRRGRDMRSGRRAWRRKRPGKTEEAKKAEEAGEVRVPRRSAPRDDTILRGKRAKIKS